MSHLYVSILIFSILSACGLMIASSDLRAWRKMFVIVMLVVAGVISYRGMNTIRGYPALLQSDFGDVLILGFWPDKPNGHIYLWIKEHNKTDPISYRMPYSLKLHKKLQKARAKHKGKPYRGKVKSKNYPLEKFDDTVDDPDVQELPAYPPKTHTE